MHQQNPKSHAMSKNTDGRFIFCYRTASRLLRGVGEVHVGGRQAVLAVRQTDNGMVTYNQRLEPGTGRPCAVSELLNTHIHTYTYTH